MLAAVPDLGLPPAGCSAGVGPSGAFSAAAAASSAYNAMINTTKFEYECS